MRFLKLLKQKKQKDFLVLDIGSSSVKGLVFERGAKKNIIKKFSIRDLEKFGVFAATSFELEIIKKAVKKIIDELGIQKQVSEIPVIISFSPKILRGRIIEVPFKRKNQKQKIIKGEKQRIYNSVLKKAEKQLFDDFQKESGIIPQDLEILKKEILEKKISGYNVSSLLGHKGGNLDFKILVIFGLRDNLKILPQLKSFLGSQKINLFHEIEGLASLSEKVKDLSGIFLDLGGEFTQIFSVKKGVEWLEEFPVGGNVFTRTLCQNLGLTEKEGEDLKRRLSKNQLSKETAQNLENILSETLEIWFSQLKENLKKKAKDYAPLPSSFYLFGAGVLLPAIKKVLEEGNFGDLPLPKTLKINFLKIKDLPTENKTGFSLSVQAIPTILLTFCEHGKEDR